MINFIKIIENIHISIRGYIYFDPTNHDIRNKFDNYSKALLSKNNELNNI